MLSGLMIVTSRPGMRGVHWNRFPPRLCRKCWAQFAMPRDVFIHETFTYERCCFHGIGIWAERLAASMLR
jgi:hypothetical protein